MTPLVDNFAGAVSVVIPMFNQHELTADCLASLARHTPAGIAEIIVVDDASSPPFTTSDPRVRVLGNRHNLGFAGSCNRGAAAARGEYLLFLNNDVEALPGWLKPLLTVLAERPEVGIVAPKLIHPDGTVQHCGKVWGDLEAPHSQPSHIYYREPADAPKVNRSREYPLVTGACMLVRRAEFLALGPFDESYQNGWEDDDLCYAFRSGGKKIWYCAESTLIHYESVTLGADYRLAEAAYGRILAARQGKSSPPVSAEAEALLAPYFTMPAQELAALLEPQGAAAIQQQQGPLPLQMGGVGAPRRFPLLQPGRRLTSAAFRRASHIRHAPGLDGHSLLQSALLHPGDGAEHPAPHSRAARDHLRRQRFQRRYALLVAGAGAGQRPLPADRQL